MNTLLFIHHQRGGKNMELAACQLIKLYMQTQVLTGNIYYAPTPEARLLDALNGLSDVGPVKRGRFLELTDVIVQHADGRNEKLTVSYINKATVQLAISLGDAESGRGLGAQSGPKAYPFVEKSAVPVRIETHDYRITGNMYHSIHQRIWHVLEDLQIFLPITHAHIFTIANNIWGKAPFVAVNKEHILSLQEENSPRFEGQKTVESNKPREHKNP
jgi:hypothetical protein